MTSIRRVITGGRIRKAPDGPYIRRDGETNPENFTAHRQAMIRMSQLVGDLTSAWILTGKQVYSDAAMQHIRAWFVNPDTQMNPNLLYAQAIKGVVTGRGIGIIDTIHLIEVVQSLRLMEAKRMIDKERTGDYQTMVLRLSNLDVHAPLRNQRNGSEKQSWHLLGHASRCLCLVHGQPGNDSFLHGTL